MFHYTQRMNDEKKYKFQWCFLSTISVPLIRFSILRYKDSTEEEVKITLDENKKVVSVITNIFSPLQKEDQQINIEDIDYVGKRNIDDLLKCLELERKLEKQKQFIQQELYDSLYHSLYEKKKHLSILLYRSLKNNVSMTTINNLITRTWSWKKLVKKLKYKMSTIMKMLTI